MPLHPHQGGRPTSGKSGQGEDEDEEEPPKIPLYVTEFVLEPAQIQFSPDEEDFQDGLAEVIKEFQDTVLKIQNLVPDTYFDAFTR